MDDYNEVLSYFKAHQISKKKYFDIYHLISKNIIKKIKLKKGRVLDVACGYGELINKISKYRKNLEFVGVDISKSMIKLSKMRLSNKKMNFLSMSADNLEFPNETFDFILCKDAFHHFKNPVKVLKEMFRVLKKKGVIYSIDLRRDISEEVFNQITQWASELNLENASLYVQSHNASYTLKEMRKMVEKAGIERYEISTPKISQNFLKEYGLKNKDYLMASIYLKEKWVLIIRK